MTITPTSPRLLNLAYLSLGSNVGPEHYLPAAVEKLRCVGEVLRVSRVWQSPPVGYVHQPDFCNAAVLLEIDLGAAELKREVIARIESDLDRVRDPRNRSGPRTVDIDIALFNEDLISIGGNRIPDPEILIRPFLAVPLAEIDPTYRHPQTGETLQAVARRLRPHASLHERHDIRLA
ncbi:2-amino-4-hydroxy-6-hydroxymethyldihydropteridine pyrophosphokinase [Maioricimonas rarisocia]|uniref:2-amino-4-hydroxy-6-hydroxymethyldihydropteridine diphosphokinase n=1 Tax=Maioricimonas rarisocia TaxID=2528026 RepID=A0A517Z7U3_9PLAN|nr:2-amino-4-hydroxy-6-hydroxymethyldihydropteridine diphosphokinase [Maioricimonas rarisocia]QDU38552.1 2-amino-4-hydroxy-6-hydroxymethyldihydropteridine pyrophosphokinase [Maioricimonas rarisocia]